MSSQSKSLPDTYDPSFHGDVDKHPYMKLLEYRNLGGTNLKTSNISLGTGHLGSGYYGECARSEGIATVREAIKSGINLIDTSPWYGDSEKILGEALEGIPRHTYYLATKAGRNYTPTWQGRFDFSGPAVLKSVERSLERLRTSYVDIIQVHDVEFASDLNVIINETIPALESVVRAGKAKYIGITAYDLSALGDVAEKAHVDTVLTYCRYNLHDLTLLDYLPAFHTKGIGIINASAVAMGLLTTTGPPSWHPASEETKALARKAATMATEHGTTLEDLALRFSFRPPQESISTTLVSMPTLKILKQNLEAASKPMSTSEREACDTIRAVFGNSNHHWEGVEVAHMKKELGQL